MCAWDRDERPGDVQELLKTREHRSRCRSVSSSASVALRARSCLKSDAKS